LTRRATDRRSKDGDAQRQETNVPKRSLQTFSSLLACLLAACGGSGDDSEPAVARNPLLQPQRFEETAPEAFQVRFTTSAGDVVMQIRRSWAPLGADRFYNLAKGGYYDDSRIYRVLPGFMAQFGLHADPYVTQAWKSEYLVDDPVVESNTRGRVAFAKGGLHTRTTEIFVSYKDNSQLDEEGFTPIGEVIEGMDVVDAFYSAYGDGPPRGEGPYQAMAAARGNEYLDAEFPELTRILSVTVTPGG
jgi:peptidyl-prolyl cis-trans isomerase A (cyclophilin A)